MKIPTEIKVCGMIYTVSLEKDEYLKGQQLFGECDFANQTIYIRSDLSYDRIRNILIHELLHVILFEAGKQDEIYADEDLVRPIANILYSVMVDNEEMFERGE